MTTLSLAGRRADRLDTDPPLDWRVLAVWSALFLNVLQFTALPTVLPIPGPVGQLIAQGALPLAVLLALVANPRGLMRPNAYVVAFSLLVLLALMVSLHNPFLAGSTLPRTAVRRVRGGAVAAEPLLGSARPPAAAVSPHLPARGGRLGRAGPGGRPRAGVLVRRTARRGVLADLSHPGGALRRRAARHHRRAVDVPRHRRPQRRARRGHGGDGHDHDPHADGAARGHGRTDLRVRQPAAGPFPGAAGVDVGRSARSGGAGGLRLRGHVVAAAGAEHRRGKRTHRPDQRLDGRAGRIRVR